MRLTVRGLVRAAAVEYHLAAGAAEEILLLAAGTAVRSQDGSGGRKGHGWFAMRVEEGLF